MVSVLFPYLTERNKKMKKVDCIQILKNAQNAIPVVMAEDKPRWENGKVTSEKGSVEFKVAVIGVTETCRVVFPYQAGLTDALNSQLCVGVPINLENLGEIEAILISTKDDALSVRYEMLPLAYQAGGRKGGEEA